MYNYIYAYKEVKSTSSTYPNNLPGTRITKNTSSNLDLLLHLLAFLFFALLSVLLKLLLLLALRLLLPLLEFVQPIKIANILSASAIIQTGIKIINQFVFNF